MPARKNQGKKDPPVQGVREDPGPCGPEGEEDISTTTERPKRPKCGCETKAEIYTQIGSLRPVERRPLRIHITVTSVVVCDPGTPDHCFYQYTATAKVQRFRPKRGRRPATWVDYRRRRAFIQSFTVHDDVNKTERPDRIDQVSLTLGEWYPKAPQKEKTKITLELAASVRGGWRATINRTLELCVPKLDNPLCPEE